METSQGLCQTVLDYYKRMSTAASGHSMRVAASGGNSVKTLQVFLSSANHALTYDIDEQAATCTSLGAGHTIESGKCAIDMDADNVTDCTVEHGDNSCGLLDDVFVSGKRLS